jgi:hypothetical protein
MGIPREVFPEMGYAIPFHFYDVFMKHNGFYQVAETMMGDPVFKQDPLKRDDALAGFRKTIKDGEMPTWMIESLTEVQNAFPVGQGIRCRSSTNNEDLPGFNGAGLYDSFTHHPDEGHLSNEDSANLLLNLSGEKTKVIILAHLSEECNVESKALEAYNKVFLDQGVDIYSYKIIVAKQHCSTELISLE